MKRDSSLGRLVATAATIGYSDTANLPRAALLLNLAGTSGNERGRKLSEELRFTFFADCRVRVFSGMTRLLSELQLRTERARVFLSRYDTGFENGLVGRSTFKEADGSLRTYTVSPIRRGIVKEQTMDRRYHCLHRAMENRPFYKVSCNPITSELRQYSDHALLSVLCQYSLFPQRIVTLLEIARDSLQSWHPASIALDRNIDEELGSRTSGVSHYNLFRQGIEDEYGLDVTSVVPQLATDEFLSKCGERLRASIPEFVAGVIYAIEATSIGEIACVRKIVTELSIRRFGRAPSASSRLIQFIDAHLDDFEPGHEAELRCAFSDIVNGSSAATFSRGFGLVLNDMDCWWMKLSVECA